MRDGKEYCPFCGNYSAKVKYSGKWGYFVSCRCTAVGPSRKTSQAAVEAWNTRRQPKAEDDQPTLF